MLRAPTCPEPTVAPAPRAVTREQRLRCLLADHYRHVWRCLRGFGVYPAQVDDAAQQVFMILAKRLPELEPGKERSFLTGTALRVAANIRRSQQRCREHPEEEVGHDRVWDAPSPEELLDAKRLRQLLDRALDALPDALRPVFVLVELEGASRTEAAELLDMPPGTVASRLKRARELFSETAKQLASGRRP